MENNRSQHSELNNKSWSDIFDEFLSSPPTSSIFRLYLLSFCLWNKSVILYIFFGSADMGDKLAFLNWSKFIPFYNSTDSVYYAYLFLYLGPLIVSALIFILVFGIKTLKIPSIYYMIYRKHSKAEKIKLDEEILIEDKKAIIIDAKIKNETGQRKLSSIKEQSKPEIISDGENYEEAYKKFRKTSFFTHFTATYKQIYYDKKNNFRHGDLVNTFNRDLIEFLFNDKCFSYIATNKVANMETLNQPNHDQLKFNNKGEYYIKYHEWEIGIL